MATNKELIGLILEKLHITEGGDTASADEFASVERTYTKRVEFLRDREIAWWPDDDVPLSIEDLLADYVAYHCQILPMEERGPYREASMTAFYEISALSQPRSDDGPIRTVSF